MSELLTNGKTTGETEERPTVILHLSDIHFAARGNGHHEDRRHLLLEHLVEVLNQQPRGWRPTVLCVTGDIVQSGAADEYDVAEPWFRRLIKSLSLEPDDIVMCPGNHDVIKAAAKTVMRPGDGTTADSAFLDGLPESLDEVFRGFIDFNKRLGIPCPVCDDTESYLFGERQVGDIRFVVLNSAWFCKGDKNEGPLFLGNPLIDKLGSLHKPGNGSFRSVAALVHHPPDFLHESERYGYQLRPATFRRVAEACDFTLTGHAHGKMEPADEYAGCYVFQGGALYVGPEEFHHFRLLRLTSDGCVEKRFEASPREPDWPWQPMSEEKPYTFGSARGMSTSDERTDSSQKSVSLDRASVLQFPSIPALSDGPYLDALVLALLLGKWQEGSDLDRKAVETLADTLYSDWVRKIRQFLQQDEPAVTLQNGSWEVADCLKRWEALGGRVFDEQMRMFGQVAQVVLRSFDPSVTLERTELFELTQHETTPKYSANIRKGVATTLAILGNNERLVTRCSTNMIPNTVISTLREVLKGSDWKLWASLRDVLPLLAEAAPMVFLDAVESAMSARPCPFDSLLRQEREGPFSRTYIPGLLWALETLAWEREHFVRVVGILGRLAAIDPGGNHSNRPSNSLNTVLLPWLPQTIAPVEVRLVAVQNLVRDVPDVAWKLLLSLLPQATQSSVGCRRPEWRKSIPSDWKDGVTSGEFWRQTEAYAAMALECAKKCPDKLAVLLSEIDKLPPDARRATLEYTKSIDVTDLDEVTRTPLWKALDSEARKHRHYADSNWALSEETVKEIEAAANAIAPKSHSLRSEALFSLHGREFWDHEATYEENQERLQGMRQEAVAQVLEQEGYPAVLALSHRVEAPRMVGFALGQKESEAYDNDVIPSLLADDEERQRSFSEGYTQGRFGRSGWPWVDSLKMGSWTPEQKGRFFGHLPFGSETWRRVESSMGEDEGPYWVFRALTPWGPDASLLHAVERFLQYGQPNAAAMCVGRMLEGEESVETSVIVRVLEAISVDSKDVRPLDSHALTRLITKLQERNDISVEDMVGLELKFVVFLEHEENVRPIASERRLAADPSFFFDVICMVYRSENDMEEDDGKEPTEEERARAAIGLSLLFGWKYPPGRQENNGFDSEHFAKWLSKVKELCSGSGHLAIALEQAGKVLRYCPEDPAGLWLPLAVAEALDAEDAAPMREGLRMEFYNSRGVACWTGAGQEEKELAEKYERYAQAVEAWPRLAAEMRALSEEYRREAEGFFWPNDM